MSTCYATEHSATTYKEIIHDGSGQRLQEPSEVIGVLRDKTIKGACHIVKIIQNHLKTQKFLRWVPRNSKD